MIALRSSSLMTILNKVEKNRVKISKLVVTRMKIMVKESKLRKEKTRN